MKIVQVLLTAVIVIVAFGSNPGAAADLNDPYQIVNNFYDAIGGLDKIKAEKSSYYEAAVSMAGLEGTITQWSMSPIFSRQVFDLKVFKQTTGDNGEESWVVDGNGKLLIIKDEAALKRREISKLRADYDFLNRDSKNFRLTFEGIEKVNDVDCYVVKTSNSINDDITLDYYNTADFILIKSIEKHPDEETHVLLSDYRDANGIKRSFAQEVEVLPVGQKISIRIEKFESNPDIDPAIFEPPAEDVRDFTFTNGNKAEDIPFQFIGEHLYLPVNVNGREKLWILDTGAEMTVLTQKYADELGLEVKGNMKGSGAGNTIDVGFTTLPPFSLKGIEFDSQKVAVIEISQFFDRFGLDVSGILGYDFLSRFVTKVDYDNQTLSFYDPENFAYTGNGVMVETPLRGNMFNIPITIDGKYTGQCTMDLGAGTSNIHYAYAVANGLMDRPGIERIGMGAGGEFAERMLRFDSIEFGGFVLQKPIIDIGVTETKGAFSSKEQMGNLGNTLFRHFVLYLDYKNQRIFIEKGKSFDREFPEDKAGCQLWLNEKGQYEVRNAPAGTPAQKAGLMKGDIIKSINNIEMKSFGGYFAVADLFKADAGTTYDLMIERNGVEKRIKIELKELL
ncbi:MAG: aspartyl protease family protein [Candidatus Zixiibacteriota bacterium]